LKLISLGREPAVLAYHYRAGVCSKPTDEGNLQYTALRQRAQGLCETMYVQGGLDYGHQQKNSLNVRFFMILPLGQAFTVTGNYHEMFLSKVLCLAVGMELLAD
jgi:hypothetical protein